MISAIRSQQDHLRVPDGFPFDQPSAIVEVIKQFLRRRHSIQILPGIPPRGSVESSEGETLIQFISPEDGGKEYWNPEEGTPVEKRGCRVFVLGTRAPEVLELMEILARGDQVYLVPEERVSHVSGIYSMVHICPKL